MTQQKANQNRKHANPQNRQTRPIHTRAEVEAMLRELAFVLKMTQRVRKEIDSEREADKVVTA